MNWIELPHGSKVCEAFGGPDKRSYVALVSAPKGETYEWCIVEAESLQQAAHGFIQGGPRDAMHEVEKGIRLLWECFGRLH